MTETRKTSTLDDLPTKAFPHQNATATIKPGRVLYTWADKNLALNGMEA